MATRQLFAGAINAAINPASIFRCLVFIIFLCVPAISSADVAIIANKSTPRLEKEYISRIYSAKIKVMPNGKKVSPMDLPDGDKDRSVFYRHMSNKNEVQMRAYWSRLVFTGAGDPPVVVDDSEEVLSYIREHENAIGYVNTKYVDGSVKVLMVLPE